MVAILEMPPTSREIEGTGTLYFWPYLVNSDLTSLTLGDGGSQCAQVLR